MGGASRFFQNRPKKTCQLGVYLRKLMYRIPSRESARKPRENIETLNMDSRIWSKLDQIDGRNRRLCTNI